ncbi:addiction module toxin RelE, partial [Serratia marcescens]
MRYPTDFKLQPGGQCVNPQELTPVSDWGERTQPTTLR